MKVTYLKITVLNYAIIIVKALITYLPNKIVFGKNDSIPSIINFN